jgi:hypothetical protein
LKLRRKDILRDSPEGFGKYEFIIANVPTPSNFQEGLK